MFGLDGKVVNDLNALRSVGATRNLVASIMTGRIKPDIENAKVGDGVKS